MGYPRKQFPRPFFGEPRPKREAERLSPQLQRELDESVGEYRDRSGTPGERVRRIAAKVAVASLLAIAAVAGIATILDSNLGEHEARPVPKKPVTVQIIPSGK